MAAAAAAAAAETAVGMVCPLPVLTAAAQMDPFQLCSTEGIYGSLQHPSVV
jgi:hypothetical protein